MKMEVHFKKGVYFDRRKEGNKKIRMYIENLIFNIHSVL